MLFALRGIGRCASGWGSDRPRICGRGGHFLGVSIQPDDMTKGRNEYKVNGEKKRIPYDHK
jgi:hypothetical protein